MSSGQRLGSYLLEGELGRGGMGVVYRARHLQLGAERAVKVLEAGADPEALERFRLEVEALGRAGGEGIVPVHDTGVDRGRLYYAMALLPGGSLRERLRREGELPWREAARLVSAIAHAVGRCHAAGLVHRDLKPENILLDAEGRPLVADFGCVRDLGGQRLTQTGQTLGTPAYMAPEQLGGARGDPRADVFALGAILHELVAGARPYEGRGHVEIYQRASQGKRASLTSVHGAPVALEAVAACALAPDPDARFQNARDLAQALDAALSSEARRSTRARLLAGTAVAGTALGVAIALGAWGRAARPSPSPTPSVSPTPSPPARPKVSPTPAPSPRATPRPADVERALSAFDAVGALALLDDMGSLETLDAPTRRRGADKAAALYSHLPDPAGRQTKLEDVRKAIAAYDVECRFSGRSDVPSRIVYYAQTGTSLVRGNRKSRGTVSFAVLCHWYEVMVRGMPDLPDAAEDFADEWLAETDADVTGRVLPDALAAISSLEATYPLDAQLLAARARVLILAAERAAPPDRARWLDEGRKTVERAIVLATDALATVLATDRKRRTTHALRDARFLAAKIEATAGDAAAARRRLDECDQDLLMEKERTDPDWAMLHASIVLGSGGRPRDAAAALRRGAESGKWREWLEDLARALEQGTKTPADVTRELGAPPPADAR